MKRKEYNKTHNLSQLHNELLTAIPKFNPVIDVNGERVAVIYIEGNDDGFIGITFPDPENIHERVVDQVVEDHVLRPDDVEIENERTRLVINRMRRIAIDQLISEGLLPEDYTWEINNDLP